MWKTFLRGTYPYSPIVIPIVIIIAIVLSWVLVWAIGLMW